MVSRRFLKSHRALLFAIAGVVFVVSGTVFALRWAKGYRPTLGNKGPTLRGTGLLVATSDPKGAQVFLNGKLTTATDDTLNLTPGAYDVEIQKEGFSPWKKNIAIVAELVTQANARLFPSVPNLLPLTFPGISNPLPSPDGQKIVYRVDGASVPAKNGLWVIEMSERGLPIARTSVPKQIARSSPQVVLNTAILTWTPDSSQVLAYWTEGGEGTTSTTGTTGSTSESIQQAILFSISGLNDESTIRDATSRLPVLVSQWHQDLDLSERDRWALLPDEMQLVATQSANFVFFSPDERYLLYKATGERNIPDHLIPDLPSESTQEEHRDLKAGALYVYDLKEDRNYLIGEGTTREAKPTPTIRIGGSAASPDPSAEYWTSRIGRIAPDTSVSASVREPLPPVPTTLLPSILSQLSNRYTSAFSLPVQWFPTSQHLLKKSSDRVSIVDFDGNNDVTVYAGPFDASFIYPWPDGSRVVILTSLNETGAANLYTINLR